MKIAILAPTLGAGADLRSALGDTAESCTVSLSWADLLGSLEGNTVDLVLAERSLLRLADLSTLERIAEGGRLPPVLLIDAAGGGGPTAVSLLRQLTRGAPDTYEIGALCIDTRKRRARIRERWVTLPPIQYRLLLALAKRAGEVVACQELLREVWGYESSEAEARELVKVHIRQIRRRIGLDPEKHHYVRSVRGFGYMLTSPDDE
jgi:DNA-binding winged helix-turn-helix (wHTH) protein